MRIINRFDRGFVYPMLLLLASLLLLFQFGCPYFPESTFQLSEHSRIPTWIKLPQGLPRSQVLISMSYFNRPWEWGGRALFIVRDSETGITQKLTGRFCGADFKPESNGQTLSYPAYKAIVVDGQTELIEHRAMEPVFYVTDDAAVKQHFRMLGCF